MPFHLSRILGGAIFAVLLTATLAACSRQPEAQPVPLPAVTIAAPTAPPAIATAQATSRPAPTAAPAATSVPQSASSTAPTATTTPQPAATPAPTAATSAEQASQAGSPAVFSLGEGTIARYKVEEVLARAGFKVATGETSEVEGQIVFDAEGGIVADESRIVIQAGALTTDSDRRDRYVRERTLQTAEYPEVVFRPTSAEGLPLLLSEAGGEVEFTISGDLTIRDQTRPVTWDVAAEFGDGISGLATIDITFKQFAMDKPSVAIVVSVGDTFSLELDFVGSIEQIAAMNTDDDDDDMAAGTSDEPDIADEAYAQVLGSEDALVTVVEFSDFQWPHCRTFALGPGRQIIEEFVDSGKVRFAYRHFVVISEASVIAAMGTECAAEQDMFWEFHDAIFDNWQDARQNDFAYSWLKGTADSLSMDAADFEECMQSGRAFKRVKASQLDAMERGVNSTPSVFVDGNRVFGDYETYRQAIQNALQVN